MGSQPRHARDIYISVVLHSNISIMGLSYFDNQSQLEFYEYILFMSLCDIRL